MASNYKKFVVKAPKKVKIPKSSSRSSLFPKSKTSFGARSGQAFYSKKDAKQDPFEYSSIGFGDTGLKGDT